MEFAEFVHTCKRYRWTLLATIAATTIGLVLNGALQPTSYRSTSLVQIPGTIDGDGVWRDYDLAYSERVAQTYISLAQSMPVRSALQRDLDLDTLPAINVELLPTTELVLITVDGPDEDVVVDVADQMSVVFRDRLWQSEPSDAPLQAGDELKNRLAELEANRTDLIAEISRLPQLQEGRISPALSGLQAELDSLNGRISNIQSRIDNFETTESLLDGPITIIEEASRPATPSGTNLPLLAFLGLALGTIGGVIFVLARRALDRSIGSPDDAQWVSGLPVLGELDDEFDAKSKDDVAARDSEKDNLIERLAANQFLTKEPSDVGRVILVTTPSMTPEPTRLGERLVDVYHRLGIDAFLYDSDEFDRSADDGFDSDERHLLADFDLYRKEYDVIVINGPGYLNSLTIPLFRIVADETIIVADLKHTDRSDLRRIARELDSIEGHPASVVVTSGNRRSTKRSVYSDDG